MTPAVAGRGEDAGRVLIQSYNPESEPIRRVVMYDFMGFSEGEFARRQMLALRLEGAHPEQKAEVARQLAEILSKHLPPAKVGVRLLGPAPAPISRIKGKTRWQILLKAPSHAAMAAPLNAVEKFSRICRQW